MVEDSTSTHVARVSGEETCSDPRCLLNAPRTWIPQSLPSPEARLRELRERLAAAEHAGRLDEVALLTSMAERFERESLE